MAYPSIAHHGMVVARSLAEAGTAEGLDPMPVHAPAVATAPLGDASWCAGR